MCLAVPGEIVSVTGDDTMSRTGEIRFGAVVREVALAFVPEAVEGDYVLVHAGVAISVICDEAAQRTLGYLHEIKQDEDDR